MSGRDPELARGASETPDPLLELAGWHAEPMLLRRLNLYITEGILECAALAAAFVVNLGRLHETAPDTRPTPSMSANPLLVLQLLTIPLAVSAVRLAWSLSLFVGYHTFRGTATPEIIRRKGWLQRRNFWTHSATMISCLSCLTMMWHIMALLLLQGYLGRSPEDEKKLLWSLLGIDIFCIVTHGCFWRDFVKNHQEPDQDVDGERFHRLEQIYRMYRSKEISIRRYQEVSLAAGPNGSPTTCAICMEDFGHSDYLSVLPCGHYYHPACTNAWLCQKWACPLRCEVTPAGRHGKAAAQAAAPQPASAAVRLSAAARQAAAQQALAQQVPPADAGRAELPPALAELPPAPAVSVPVSLASALAVSVPAVSAPVVSVAAVSAPAVSVQAISVPVAFASVVPVNGEPS